MVVVNAVAETLRRGTPRWSEQAIKAETVRGAIEYFINQYNLHVDVANQGLNGTVHMPKLRLVEE